MRFLLHLTRMMREVVLLGWSHKRPGLTLVLLLALVSVIVVVTLKVAVPLALYPFL